LLISYTKSCTVFFHYLASSYGFHVGCYIAFGSFLPPDVGQSTNLTGFSFAAIRDIASSSVFMLSPLNFASYSLKAYSFSHATVSIDHRELDFCYEEVFFFESDVAVSFLPPFSSYHFYFIF